MRVREVIARIAGIVRSAVPPPITRILRRSIGPPRIVFCVAAGIIAQIALTASAVSKAPFVGSPYFPPRATSAPEAAEVRRFWQDWTAEHDGFAPEFTALWERSWSWTDARLSDCEFLGGIADLPPIKRLEVEIPRTERGSSIRVHLFGWPYRWYERATESRFSRAGFWIGRPQERFRWEACIASVTVCISIAMALRVGGDLVTLVSRTARGRCAACGHRRRGEDAGAVRAYPVCLECGFPGTS